MPTDAIFLNLGGFFIILTLAGLILVLAVKQLGPRDGLRWTPAIILIAVFLAITHLPITQPVTMSCDGTKSRPLFAAFRFMDAIIRRWQADLPLVSWLKEAMFSTTALNLHACIAIGAALAMCVRRWSVAVIIGASMTCFVEASQLTGVFGLFHCPWRQFDVDDLILNLTGVTLGFFLARIAGTSLQTRQRSSKKRISPLRD
jgi:glycopeptide antibiotics resistance protein